jgi:hypothetical protein
MVARPPIGSYPRTGRCPISWSSVVALRQLGEEAPAIPGLRSPGAPRHGTSRRPPGRPRGGGAAWLAIAEQQRHAQSRSVPETTSAAE